MNKDNKPTVSYDGSIFTTLQLIFLVLKLTGLIDWSWWLVFTPFFASSSLPLTPSLPLPP